nr:unnamed protein product [Callosobruchus analis]
MHYPKQQQCIIDLLEQMEDCGVMPDFEMEDQLVNIFGKRGFPVRKYWRMMYWMPKFKNLSPYPVPDPLPNDTFELAKYAIERINSSSVENEDVNLDDVSKLKVSLFNLTPPVGKHLRKIPSVHEQDDGTIFSVCATGTSSQDSLLSWIRHLENDGNPKLGKVQVVFTLRTGSKEIANVGEEQEKIEDK